MYLRHASDCEFFQPYLAKQEGSRTNQAYPPQAVSTAGQEPSAVTSMEVPCLVVAFLLVDAELLDLWRTQLVEGMLVLYCCLATT